MAKPKLSQQLKQTQGIMITPQLQQAIKMLTLTHLEMTNIISEEMIENPMLEETGVDDSERRLEEDYTVENLENQNQEVNPDEFREKTVVEKDDFDWSNYVSHFDTNSSTAAPSMVGKSEEDYNYENIISENKSLFDHLMEQIGVEHLPEHIVLLSKLILLNLNEDGYLEASIEELVTETDCSKEEIESTLEMIQNLDPIGCATFGLEDCLIKQAKILGFYSDLFELVVREHLKDLKGSHFDLIAKKVDRDIEAIKGIAEILKGLNPRPGRLIDEESTKYIVPDIFVQKVGGRFEVQVNDDGVPKLKVNELYKKMLANPKFGDKDSREFFEEKMKAALWLIKSVQNRQKTIVQVAKSIVERQQEFFHKGPMYLRPMILKDVANEIGMHESTVSRVTNNKYMHTPIGVFELKYFFNAGLGGKQGGVEISNEALKVKLKKIIQSENPMKPFSDQKLSILLSQDDVKVARRTVAKYREILGIESSSKRKKRA